MEENEIEAEIERDRRPELHNDDDEDDGNDNHITTMTKAMTRNNYDYNIGLVFIRLYK